MKTIRERSETNHFNPSRTPAVVSLKFLSAQSGDKASENSQKPSGINSFSDKTTRKDIKFRVSFLSRHVNSLTNQHWQSGKQPLRYLQFQKNEIYSQ